MHSCMNNLLKNLLLFFTIGLLMIGLLGGQISVLPALTYKLLWLRSWPSVGVLPHALLSEGNMQFMLLSCQDSRCWSAVGL